MLVKRPLAPELSWFPQARFGMFIHFGLYALLGRGEWVMYQERIPREIYEKLMRRFNPRRFDAETWVRTAVRAGARYITVTAKHHDGFCLFDSALTDYKITRTPFGRDLIGELITACHRHDMRIILYYSQPDWHHPNFVNRPGAFKDWPEPRPGDAPDWPRYLRYCHGQVEELCTRYGRIDGIWFDGSHKSEAEWQGRRLYRLIKRHQPHAVVNDRAGYGDFFTPERRLSAAAAAAGYMVEACQSVCQDAWGYKRDARLFSAHYLIESLVRMAAAGGNYLLNIGPAPDGSLPPEQVRRLLDVGAWLRAHGDAIYGTAGCPLREESDDMLYTVRGNRLFLHLLRWPVGDAVLLRRLRYSPRRAFLLKTHAPLRVEAQKDGILLRGLPSLPPDAAVNVIEMRFDGPANKVLLSAPRAPRRRPLIFVPGAPLTLSASDATCAGFGTKGTQIVVRTLREATVRLVREAETYLTNWSKPEQRAFWWIECPRPMRCQVAVEMACPAPYAGSTFTVRVGGQTLRGTVPATRDERHFRRVRLGVISLPAGVHRLCLAPERLQYGYVFANVRCVVMKPCPQMHHKLLRR